MDSTGVLMSMLSTDSQRVRIAVVVVGVFVLAALGLRLAWPEPVLAQAGGVGQSCLMCRQTGWGDTFTLRASSVTRSYRFTRRATAQLEFDSGTVHFGGTEVTPGCHVLSARAEQRLEFEAASGVRVDVPAPAGGCQ